MWFKLHVYNSAGYIKHISFVDGNIPTYNSIAGMFSGYKSPFKWLRFEECYFETIRHILFTEEMFNLEVRSSYFNTSRCLLGIYIFGVHDCSTNQEGIGGNFIWDNNTVSGDFAPSRLALFYTLQRINLTYTNNKFINLYWDLTQPVFLHEDFYVPCAYEDYLVMQFENNTFEFTPD